MKNEARVEFLWSECIVRLYETKSVKEAFPGEVGLTRESEFAPMAC